MLHTYIMVRTARPIIAFLIFGSMMGFVVGQQLGHPPAHAVVHAPVVARHTSSTGALGASPLVQPAHAPVTFVPASQQKHSDSHDHGGHSGGDGQGGHGGGDGGGG